MISKMTNEDAKKFLAEKRAVSRKSECTGSVLTKREQLLGQALCSVLIACGALREDCDPDGADLLCAAECFCENQKKQNIGIDGNFPPIT